MNTNSKHYEELDIQPWEIMERNFTTEEFVAYLKGNIIKYTLRDKGQDLTDAEKIKHYAEKLIEVLETKENDKDNWTITEVGLEKPVFKPIIVKDSKFKVGDRVRILTYLRGQTGTVIRQPVLGLREVDEENYIVELDEGEEGWEATKREHLVDSERAWYVDDDEIELLQEEPKKTLKPNKWYHTTDFTKEELEELLPVGTKVETEACVIYNGIDTTAPTETNSAEVKGITKGNCDGRTFIITDSTFKREWFKIVEEN